ncbi:MAG: CPBP family intramembrane metalloprotease [Oscillospiraceae bacterium]|jgi:membrane protease YdiL (CAAX protease family)|nr:CPBP family intramembrane metalloprotease [Oscillospiraceae bacterium]
METNTLPAYGLPRRIWRALYPTLLFIVALSIIAIIVAVIAVMVQAVGQGLTDPEQITQMSLDFMAENLMTLNLAGQIAALIIFVPMWFATRKKYRRWNGGKLDIKTILLLIALAIGAYFFISLGIGLSGLTKIFTSYEAVEASLSSGSILLQVLSLGIAAPLVEELCFRGITLNRLSNAPLWVAIAVQAVLFGVAHMNPLQGIYAGIIGLLFGYLYTQFRSIWVPLIAHATFNLVNVGLVALGDIGDIADVTEAAEEAMTTGEVVSSVVMLLCGLGVAVACFIALKKRMPAPVAAEIAAEPAEDCNI